MENNQTERLTFKGEPPMAKRDTTVTVERIPLKKIKLGHNSRLDVEPEHLEGLMQSIKELGLLQPIGVVKKKDGYEIAYGNRRYLACSKLGVHSIPAIVHEEKTEWDVDAKNLAENVQRRNISPLEVGRYVASLEQSGLSRGEIAIRLGAPPQYVRDCLSAYQEVPEEFREQIAASTGKGTKAAPGMISISTTREILNAKKKGLVNTKQIKKLFKAAAHSTEFKPTQIKNYVDALAAGAKDPLKTHQKTVNIQFIMNEKEWSRLEKKYVKDGPFNSMTSLFKSIVTGTTSEQVKLLN